MQRRNNAIAFAVAVNKPEDLDKVLPPPPTTKPEPKQDFVEDRWW